MIPDFLKDRAAQALTKYSGIETHVTDCRPVTGGCINECFELSTSAGKYFLKYNDAHRFPDMFKNEASGLQLLHEANAIAVPSVIACGEINKVAFLILEWIEGAAKGKNFWVDSGRKVAALHRRSYKLFGLSHDNYIGSLAQSNRQSSGWMDFFISERLEPQLKLALDHSLIDGAVMASFGRLYTSLPDLIPEEKPSLLHGDLWSGNFMVNKNGAATLVDPAVYYGHREMDLAMSKLFGGFEAGFYSGYQEEFPLAEGFEERIDIHNLYPLLVHVNLFGKEYLQQVKTILKRFS